MAESKKHRETAQRIARKEGVEYNRGPGPDVPGKTRKIEVETAKTVADGIRQLQGYKDPVYIAGVDDSAVQAALERTKGTTVGVMNSQGKIVKRSTRKRR